MNDFSFADYGAFMPGLDALTATGSSQADAAPLRSKFNHFTTVPAGAGCKLPWVTIQTVTEIIVINHGQNAIYVYPPESGTIDSLAPNAPAQLLPGQVANWICYAAPAEPGKTWYTSFQLQPNAPNAFRAAAGVPSDTLGQDGDYYLDTNTGNLYQRQSGHYTLVMAGAAGGGPAGGDLTGTYPNPTLVTTGVTAGSYNYTSLTVDAKGRITAAASGTVPSPVFVGDTPPGIPQPNQLWWDSVGGQLYIFYADPNSSEWVIANSGGIADAPNDGGLYARSGQTWVHMPLPIAFPFAGKPGASAMVNVPMPVAVTVPAGLAGTVVFDGTQTTANATFTLNKISSGVTTVIGTVTITSTSHTSCTLSGAGGSLAVGDVLQIVAPGTQDATLSDLGITILCSRV